MANLNKAILIGRLGNDPEGFMTKSSKQGANLRLATSESWTDKEGKRQERTQWHRITVYGKQAESCLQYLGKGRLVAVEGRIQYTSYTDREDNQRISTDIVADQVTFLDSPKAQTTERAAAAA